MLQGKLVPLYSGRSFDVAADIRKIRTFVLNGLVSIFLLKAKGSCGYLRFLLIGSCSDKWLNLFIRHQTITRANMKEVLFGMILILILHGNRCPILSLKGKIHKGLSK